MNRKPAPSGAYLGIECGGTNSFALLVDDHDRVRHQAKAGPANLRLISDPALTKHFKAIAPPGIKPDAIAIGMAGARTVSDRARIQRAASRVWPDVPCYATNDLETALASAVVSSPNSDFPRVLVLSGTGSCCYGRTGHGDTAKAGGWGHLLGDRGSGYEIGLRGLQTVIAAFDHTNRWPKLGERFLRATELNEPDDFIAWAQAASKADVASLAPEVFHASSYRDPLAAHILAEAATRLATDALACARKLAGSRTRVVFVFSGSVLLKQPAWAGQIERYLQKQRPGSVVVRQERPSVWGAVALAKTRAAQRISPPLITSPQTSPAAGGPALFLRDALHRSPTEQRHPRSMRLDKMTPAAAIDLMLSEDETIPGALKRERRKLQRALDWIVQSFRRGGRLFYVGAGTSGRLGVLDASECPPTFRTSPEMVQGIIAGGQQALWQAVEGAEDDPAAGARAMKFRNVSSPDVVVGIAASGRTPFVWGALREARLRKARTILLCFNPAIAKTNGGPELIIAPDLGPELLTGSTRLKSGTATKLILNIFTTLAMVRMGKVVSNLMIDVAATNEKLRDRAIRIVRDLTGADEARARAALVRHGWLIKPTVAVLKRR